MMNQYSDKMTFFTAKGHKFAILFLLIFIAFAACVMMYKTLYLREGVEVDGIYLAWYVGGSIGAVLFALIVWMFFSVMFQDYSEPSYVFDFDGVKTSDSYIKWSDIDELSYIYESSGDGGNKCFSVKDKRGQTRTFGLELLQYHGKSIAPEVIFSLFLWLANRKHKVTSEPSTEFYPRRAIGNPEPAFDVTSTGIVAYSTKRHDGWEVAWATVRQIDYKKQKGGQAVILSKSGKHTLSLNNLSIHIDEFKGNVDAEIAFEIIMRAYQTCLGRNEA